MSKCNENNEMQLYILPKIIPLPFITSKIQRANNAAKSTIQYSLTAETPIRLAHLTQLYTLILNTNTYIVNG